MLGPRHILTQLCAAFLLFAGLGCEEEQASAAEGGDYELCDGSDRIRLGYQSGGGHVDEGYEFLHPYGYQFLFVDGHCDFILADASVDTPGSFMRGHLNEESADELGRKLMLDQLPTGVFLDQESCLDAGGSSLATSRFYGGCGCACDRGAPAALVSGIEAMADVLTTLRAEGAADSGEVEVAAIVRSSDAQPAEAPAWPFSWPATDIVNDTLNDTNEPFELRALHGADAETARELRSEAGDESVVLQSGSVTYHLFVRDRIEPELVGEIERFQRDVDPRVGRPISACGNDPELTVELGGVYLYGQRLYASFSSLPVCGARICWDGEFRERQPVVAALRVVKDTSARPCLSLPATGAAVTLEPLVSAFEASYPDAKLEIVLTLPGWTEEPLLLTSQP